MSDVTMLAKVKTALRITHNRLDSEIADNIAAARAELQRAGVAPSIANDDQKPLVCDAIKTYCQYKNARSIDEASRYFESFKYQMDNMRKSSAYNIEPEAEDGE